MTAKPLFLLDIDGVTNALPYVFDGYDHITKKPIHKRIDLGPEYSRTEALGYGLTFHQNLASWITEVERMFDCVHATMWQHRAHHAYRAMGIVGPQSWEYIDFDAANDDARAERLATGQMTGRGVGNHKHAGIVARLGDRPGIWVDDDMETWQIRWAQKRWEAGIPTLFIRPDATFGITEKHMKQIRAFAEAVSEYQENAA